MKHVYLLLLVFFSVLTDLAAQTTPPARQYYFSTQQNVQLEDMSEAILLHGPGVSEAYSQEISLPFVFDYAGHAFTSFMANTDFVHFLPLTTSTALHGVAPWMGTLATESNGHVKYKTIGTTNRKVVIEWFVGAYGFGLADKKVQVWLFEGSNKIQIVFGDAVMDDEWANDDGIVGLVGEDATDILWVNSASNTTFTEMRWINENAIWPGAGFSYVFSPVEEVIVTPPPVATIETEDATVICPGGSVVFNAALEGADATAYQWYRNDVAIDGATDAVYTATGPGNYQAKISYANGEVASQTANIVVVSITASVQSTNPTCNEANNGTITIVNAEGGTGEYEYRINNSDWQTNNNFGGLPAGVYVVEMRDIATQACILNLGTATLLGAGTAPEVSIASTSKEGCASVKLTANPAKATYLWSNGATSQVLELTNADADGIYTVTVTTNGGCAASASYNFTKENLLKSYTVVATRYLFLHENNTVNGGVGNTKQNGIILVNKDAAINGFVKGDLLFMAPSAQVSGAVSHDPAVVNLPVMRANTSITKNLPNKSVANNFVGTVTGNYRKLTIGDKAKVTLTGNVFGVIEIKEGADVTFTGTDISIDEIVTEDGIQTYNGINFTSTSFAPNTIVRVKNKVHIGNRNQVFGEGATLFMGDLSTDDERVVVSGKNTQVTVNVYMPNGILAVRNAEAGKPCIMNGLFIAEVVMSDRFVQWNSNLCHTSLLTRIAQKPVVQVPLVAEAKELKLYPNPAKGVVTLQLDNVKAGKAEVVIMNKAGAVVHRQTLQAQPGHTVQYDVSSYPSGVYTVRIVTGENVRTIKLAVQR